MAAAERDSQRPIIIVKRRKRGDGRPHGGAWKVAYADFVTALMAFFMVMWLVASVSKEQRAAIYEYFRNPSMEQGKSTRASPGQQGPGGASTSPIDLGGGMDAPKSSMMKNAQPSFIQMPNGANAQAGEQQGPTEQEKIVERKQLDALMQELKEAINESQALEPFKDQLLLDIMPEGLRIQIVDAKNRSMFDLGSAQLKQYTIDILAELAPYLNSVPNRIMLAGHTDITQYANTNGYTNWELSADRANAARRILARSGVEEAKIARVVGLGSVALFDKNDPKNPINRRISIIVMTKAADDDALRLDLPAQLEAEAINPMTMETKAAVPPIVAGAATAP